GQGRHQSRAPAGWKVWKQVARVGLAAPTPSAGDRPRRRAANGAGTATGTRPDARVRIRERRDVVEGSVLVHLAVVPRSEEGLERVGRLVGREEGDRNPG